MPHLTKERIEQRVTALKKRLAKVAKEKLDSSPQAREVRKKLKRAQRRMRAMLGKPHPRKIFRTILRPGAKAAVGGAQGQQKKA